MFLLVRLVCFHVSVCFQLDLSVCANKCVNLWVCLLYTFARCNVVITVPLLNLKILKIHFCICLHANMFILSVKNPELQPSAVYTSEGI